MVKQRSTEEAEELLFLLKASEIFKNTYDANGSIAHRTESMELLFRHLDNLLGSPNADLTIEETVKELDGEVDVRKTERSKEELK